MQTETQTIIDCKDAAESVGLTYASTDARGFTRRRVGKGFSYRGLDGKAISDRTTLSRIRSLAIPPAWTSVWICPKTNGHVQAVGYDAKGRKQYRYHPKFREVREGVKYEHMMAFAQALPKLRRKIAEDMALGGLGRRKVLATVVNLLETTMIRVGNESYAKENSSFGLTTLLNRHVKIESGELKFHFTGKSGKVWRLSVRDRRIARIVKGCQELPGQQLFQYLDHNGERQAVTSADVNAYLKEVSGEHITAKDFRTWTGTVLAAMALAEFEKADNKARAKKNVTKAVERVASMLGNTPTICRKCYIHPRIVNDYLDGALLIEVKKEIDQHLREDIKDLRPEEAAVFAFLRDRVDKDLSDLNQASASAGKGRRVRPERRRRGKTSAALEASVS